MVKRFAGAGLRCFWCSKNVALAQHGQARRNDCPDCNYRLFFSSNRVTLPAGTAIGPIYSVLNLRSFDLLRILHSVGQVSYYTRHSYRNEAGEACSAAWIMQLFVGSPLCSSRRSFSLPLLFVVRQPPRCFWNYLLSHAHLTISALLPFSSRRMPRPGQLTVSSRRRPTK
jgi:DNA-directed RNA polymerase subunit RPC12/RpoP